MILESTLGPARNLQPPLDPSAATTIEKYDDVWDILHPQEKQHQEKPQLEQQKQQKQPQQQHALKDGAEIMFPPGMGAGNQEPTKDELTKIFGGLYCAEWYNCLFVTKDGCAAVVGQLHPDKLFLAYGTCLKNNGPDDLKAACPALANEATKDCGKKADKIKMAGLKEKLGKLCTYYDNKSMFMIIGGVLLAVGLLPIVGGVVFCMKGGGKKKEKSVSNSDPE
ncbi:unnamed protein product, partial [Mesorhabditis spiculigera]